MPIHMAINDDEAELSLTIDPSKGPYNNGSYASFDVSETIDRNPLASALRRKTEQLQAADGLKGIFVCDAGSSSIQDRMFGSSGFSPKQIVTQFLRTNSHIDFVITLAVWEKQLGVLDWGPRERRIEIVLYPQPGLACAAELMVLRDFLFDRLPKPRATGGNGRRQSGDPIYRWGFHGGYSMSGNKVKISLREMTELLAGRLTVADIHARHAGAPGGNREFPNRFDFLLGQGCLPVDATIISGEGADDDWIEFTFGDPDPAVSKFR